MITKMDIGIIAMFAIWAGVFFGLLILGVGLVMYALLSVAALSLFMYVLILAVGTFLIGTEIWIWREIGRDLESADGMFAYDYY